MAEETPELAEAAEAAPPAADPAEPITWQSDPLEAPGPGKAALHYNGSEPITRAGFAFAPDSVVIVPESVAHALAGRENLRIVQETTETWRHFIGVRARGRTARA